MRVVCAQTLNTASHAHARARAHAHADSHRHAHVCGLQSLSRLVLVSYVLGLVRAGHVGVALTHDSVGNVVITSLVEGVCVCVCARARVCVC